MQATFFKTTVPLAILVVDNQTRSISEEFRIFLFLTISMLALSWWINKISNDYIRVQNITWGKYFKNTFIILIQGFKQNGNKTITIVIKEEDKKTHDGKENN